MTNDLPSPTREGELIRLARMRATPRLSISNAAAKAGISAETWGYVERGYQSLGRGKPVRVHVPPADTLARMAHALDLSPKRLEDVDRSDAAEILREILRTDQPATDDLRSRPAPAAASTELSAEEQRYRRLLHEDALRRGLDQMGQIVDGLVLALREDELWDAAYSVGRIQARLLSQRLRHAETAVAKATEAGDPKRLEVTERRLAGIRAELARRSRRSPAQTAYEAVRHVRDLDDAVWLADDIDAEADGHEPGGLRRGAGNGTDG